MKTVLFLAYHYPPVSSPGAARARAFVDLLPEYGYRARVVTCSTYGGETGSDLIRCGEPVGLYRSALNPDVIDAEAGVRSRIRTKAGVVSRGVSWMKRSLLMPDGQIGWAPGALAAAVDATRRGDVDLLYTTSPPHSIHLVGRWVQKLTELPWVAEFRDTWTYDPLDPNLVEKRLRFGIERALEKNVLRHANAVIGVTGVACDYLRSQVRADRVFKVTNGIDSDVVPDTETSHSGHGEVEEGRLSLVHVGSFGYSHPERSPEPLLEAIGRVPDDGAELTLVGGLSDTERAMAERNPGRVSLAGILPRADALAQMAEADVLVLVDHPRDVRASNVPSKCYEYLATGKPILALVPDGATRDLVESLGAGICVAPNDVTAIADAVECFRTAAKRGELTRWGASPCRLAPLQRRATARDLAACFDAVLG